MRFEFKARHYLGIGFGVVVIFLSFLFLFDWSDLRPAGWYFNPVIVIGLLFAGLPFLLDFLNENKRQKELELKFLEYVRALVETVRSGVSLPQGIGRVSKADHGSLTPYVRKLANQLEWGYPLNEALTIFANDTNNVVIKRSIGIVMQAEKSGGDIASVLDSVTKSVLEIKKLKEERKTNAYNQMIQGYIIFFVFIAIMLVLQIYLVPKLTDIGGEIMGSMGGTMMGGGMGVSAAMTGGADLGPIFVVVILVQGFFTGLMIGKFSEGAVKAGVKHSVILMVSGYLLMSTVSGIFALGLLVRKEVLISCIKEDLALT